MHHSLAARRVGVSLDTGRYWKRGVRRSHGRKIYPDGRVTGPPAKRPAMNKPMDQVVGTGRLLSLQERLAIADGVKQGVSMRSIAVGLGRAPSTITREVAAHRDATGGYSPYQGHHQSMNGRVRPKPSKLAAPGRLREYVVAALARKLSPEQISNRLKIDHPDDESMRVSHETIYQALYFQARGGLKREVQAALRTGRAMRKPQDRGVRRPRFVDEMVMISDRPACIADRAIPGHWEGDLIIGKDSGSAIGTLVERATRYVMLLHLPERHDALTVRDQLVAAVNDLPGHLRGSLTWDQGAEMAAHASFTMTTNMPVYFCDPASPWQRGSNENTNGLLRQYFPKGTDLSVHGPEELEYVAQELNARPRKTLDWATPAERLRDLLQSA
ncbi:IS30 family transposase [Janibacter cremeus]